MKTKEKGRYTILILMNAFLILMNAYPALLHWTT